MEDASAFTTSPSRSPRILDARFTPTRHPGAPMMIEVSAENLRIGGAPLFARVGNARIASLVPVGGGCGFVGVLRQLPHEGDRLYVQYLGGLEHRTNVVYHAPAGSGNVA